MTKATATSLSVALDRLCRETLDAWRVSPNQVQKDYNEEQALLSGGYADRQILELVQNATDAVIGRSEARIELRIAGQRLYAANTGAPLDEGGLKALIFGSLSEKRGEEVGRFGLGFRSLLRLGGTVDFFSAGIAFRFDPSWCASEARQAARLGPDADAPGMRLVKALNVANERKLDDVLAELRWADTVVRAQLAAPASTKAMRREIGAFPTEFLLFPDADITLDLRDGTEKIRRLQRATRETVRALLDGDKEQAWHVFSRRFTVTDAAAREDAGALHARETIRMSWAIPATGRDSPAGRFWNAFPTQSDSVLPGILDSRWKVNSDRSGLTGQAWNAALMRCAAKLVAENLATLATPDDPGRPIGALPTQLERIDAPAAPLHEAIWQEVRRTAFVSNARGQLRRPDGLFRPPLDDATLQEEWCALAPTTIAARLVHHTCLASRDRVSRLDQLARRLADDTEASEDNIGDDDDEVSLGWFSGKPALRRLRLNDWLERIATSDPDSGKSVVLLAGRIVVAQPRELSTIRDLAIIPTQDGRVASATKVVFPGADATATALPVVHAALAGDEAVRDVLTRLLRVNAMDDDAWVRALKAAWNHGANPARCEEGWSLLRAAPQALADKFACENLAQLYVKTRGDSWVPCDDALLAGVIIPESDAAGHEALLIEAAFATQNTHLLKAIGLSDVPRSGFTISTRLVTFYEVQRAAIRRYRERHHNAWSAKSGTLGYLDGPKTLAGAELLGHTNGPSRARLTAFLLARLELSGVAQFQVGGKRSRATRDRYPPDPAPNPTAWLLWKYGLAQIGGDIVLLAACSEVRRSLSEEEVACLDGLLPDETAIRDQWVEDWPGFKEPPRPVWKALLRSRHTRNHADLLPLWVVAARRRFVPNSIPDLYSDKDVRLTKVFVTTDADDVQLAAEARVVCVRLDAATAAIWRKKGAKGIGTEIQVRRVGAPTDPMRAVDLVPGLADFLSDGGPAIAFVERIERAFGEATSAAPLMFEDNRLLVSREWLSRVKKTEVLQRLLKAVAERTELSAPIEEVLESIDLSEAERCRAEVAACPNLPARLLRAAGARLALVESLPTAAQRALRSDVSDPNVATLCLDVNGPGALRALQHALEFQGLRPPQRWGTDDARQFVLALGFPLSFAGAANPRPAAELTVAGPQPLPPLHDYQKKALRELLRLINADADRRRAVLSLPTGAGKTRVAVEAAIRSVLMGSHGRPLVLWVAQTDELAEQAIEAFRHVWAVEGLEATDLRVVRFWGGQRTPHEADDAQPTVVVALVQTLDARMEQEDAFWLSIASLVVIDESHHGIAPSYTRLLKHVGVATGVRQATRTKTSRREPVLLGLSATPFRSSGEEDSVRLAARFDAKVIPWEQHDLYIRLREGRILSRVDMSQLDISEAFSLTPGEVAHLDQWGELPESALVRLAGIEGRNEAILSTIEAAAERSILLFANSVDHAVELTARLSLRGIRTRAVSGDTDRSARRDAVSAFKRGEVRVICNAVVFATGFDAPSVDMVLIARPVVSPVRFMQMVGRGLRGPRNGGTERCRIVTVRDNIEGYADRNPLDWWRRYYE